MTKRTGNFAASNHDEPLCAYLLTETHRTDSVNFEDSHPWIAAAAKLIAVWGVTLYGVATLHNIALVCGIAYSGLQIYVLWRDKIRKKTDDK